MAKNEGKNKVEKFTSPEGHVRDRIIIQQTPEIPKHGVFISLNGFPFQVQPGVEVDIPRPVRKMLDTLIFTDTIQTEEGGTYTRQRPRYPYILVKEGVNLPQPTEPEPVAATAEVQGG